MFPDAIADRATSVAVARRRRGRDADRPTLLGRVLPVARSRLSRGPRARPRAAPGPPRGRRRASRQAGPRATRAKPGLPRDRRRRPLSGSAGRRDSRALDGRRSSTSPSEARRAPGAPVCASPIAHSVITGAGSGFGRAIAIELSRRHGHLVLADVDLASTEETAAPGDGRRSLVHPAVRCDVTQLADVEALASGCEGTVDLVVNNAGVASAGLVGELPIEDSRWDARRRPLRSDRRLPRLRAAATGAGAGSRAQRRVGRRHRVVAADGRIQRCQGRRYRPLRDARRGARGYVGRRYCSSSRSFRPTSRGAGDSSTRSRGSRRSASSTTARRPRPSRAQRWCRSSGAATRSRWPTRVGFGG